ncbi:UPF0280 family protein [Clostridiaceae bacterium M8S5]|nr:UPF0280 family protein [Clostridiaceae bacterium M8S5]
MYEERTYRKSLKTSNLVNFTAIIKETDLYISADVDLKKEAMQYIKKYRSQLEMYGNMNKKFIHSLKPIKEDVNAPLIANAMINASNRAGVGPMAGVAGAMAEYVGKDLLKHSNEIIIENGGDLFVASNKKRIISIYAGTSSLSQKIGIEINPNESPIGICTSSGMIGHSLSFGKADAVVVLSKDTILADAVATATCNIIKSEEDITKGIRFVKSIPDIIGVLIVINDKLGIWGDIKFITF